MQIFNYLESFSASSDAEIKNNSIGLIKSDKSSNDSFIHEVKHDMDNEKHTYNESKDDNDDKKSLTNNDCNFNKINRIYGNERNNHSLKNKNDSPILTNDEGAIGYTSGAKRQLNNDSTSDTRSTELAEIEKRLAKIIQLDKISIKIWFDRCESDNQVKSQKLPIK